MTERTTHADVVIVGLGAMGAMTAWQASARGASVVGIERFRPGHDRGSSHGGSRIFRQILFEGQEYVPLARAAHGLWRELERESDTHLLTRTGGLVIGPADGPLIRDARASAEAGGVEYELLDTPRLRASYPQHAVFDDDIAVYEPEAGVLRPEAAIRAAIELATRNGAEILPEITVRGLACGDAEVEVITDQVTVKAKRAVISTGAWFTDLIPALRLPLRIQRSCQAWFTGNTRQAYGPTRFPVFIRTSAHLDGWGIPDIDGRGVKVGAGPSVQKRWLDRPEDNWSTPTDSDLAPIEAFVHEDLPGLRAADSHACMNSRTSDRDFVIGISRENPGLVLLGGFSGHGFKHAAAIGRIAADLALEGATDIPIQRFSPDRFAAVE